MDQQKTALDSSDAPLLEAKSQRRGKELRRGKKLRMQLRHDLPRLMPGIKTLALILWRPPNRLVNRRLILVTLCRFRGAPEPN